MNETKITKFLAEQVMGWQPFLPETNPYNFVTPPIGEVVFFDPMNKIEHAFMVRDAIRDTEDYELLEKYEDAYRRYNAFDEIWDVSAERLCIAAVKAKATDAQLKGWGL
jgi:hypothetical protein